MGLKQAFKKVRDDYVIAQVRRAQLPEFPSGTMHRYRVRFSGRVQKVGFRLEMCELAKRLGLTGWCRNLEGGDVLAELQGSTERIEFLINFMDSLTRIRIRSKQMEEIELVPGEVGFLKQ